MKKPPAEANSGRVTDRGRKARRNGQLMDKNRIEGRHGGTSWHNTAKSTGSVVEVNGAVVPEATCPYLGRPAWSRQEVSRGHSIEQRAGG